MNTLPPWLEALRHRADGESPGEHIARMVRSCAGVSLDHHPEKLAAIFFANERDAATARQVSTSKTNCGTTMRQFMCLGGCDHPLARCAYKVGRAVTWVLTIAREKGALLPPKRWREAGPGWGLHYATPVPAGHKPLNDDHVEWLLQAPDSAGVALHGGGGRSRNAITLAGPNSILWSSGRPLRALIHPDLVLAPTVHQLTTSRGVQAALNQLGARPELVVDGILGPKSRAAVAWFQASHGLTPSGNVDAATRGALARALA